MSSITEQELQNFKRLHFIGIGGSGMFPLVQILSKENFIITGSDNNPGDNLIRESAMGIKIYMGHSEENVYNADAVVFSAAIMDSNPELIYAREHKIPTIERSELLGLLSRRYNNCLCISGTHGKTTTTAMLTQILLNCNMDPSCVIGGKVSAIGGSGRAGNSDCMTIEACEFKDTFLHLSPSIAVILNIDRDHMEYFKTLNNLKASFTKFADSASKAVIYNNDDENTRDAVKNIKGNLISFGSDNRSRYYCKNVTWSDGAHASFDLFDGDKKLTTLPLNVPGEHNILNAVAAAVTAITAGAPIDSLSEGLGKFRGVERRFQILGEFNGVTVADDYAHHPAELTATLKAAKKLNFKRIWAVFQPFTFSRTAMLLDEFALALSIADRVVMSDIMAAREVNTYHIETSDLANKIPDSVWFKTFPEISQYIRENAKSGDLVITLGCGDVYKCAHMILNDHKY